MANATSTRALSVRQLAARWAITPKKVRAMIRAKLIDAINVGLGNRSQLRITPEAIVKAEQRLAVVPPKRQRRRPDIDPQIARLLED